MSSGKGGKMCNRGIIVTAPFRFDGHTVTTGSGIDPVSLRQYLLYWDRIDWPDNNILSIGNHTPETEFLEEAGILERTRVEMHLTENIGYAPTLAQARALTIRNETEPGRWSLAQQADCLVLSEETSQDARVIEVELYSGIPVPDREVSLEDVLLFKKRRRPELLAFRSAMDELYQGVIAASDIPRAKITAIETIELRLADLHSVFKESWGKRLLSSVKTELNTPTLLTGAALGALVLSPFDVPLALGPALGVGAAAIKFSFGLTDGTIARRLPTQLKDFAYLHRIEEELR